MVDKLQEYLNPEGISIKTADGRNYTAEHNGIKLGFIVGINYLNGMPKLEVIDGKNKIIRGVYKDSSGISTYCAGEETFYSDYEEQEQNIADHISNAFYNITHGKWYYEFNKYAGIGVLHGYSETMGPKTKFIIRSKDGLEYRKTIIKKIVDIEWSLIVHNIDEISIMKEWREKLNKSNVYRVKFDKYYIYLTAINGIWHVIKATADSSVKYKNELSKNEILVIGYGSVGSYIVDYLAKSWQNITVMDYDYLSLDNCFRHFLPPTYIGERKVDAGKDIYLLHDNITWLKEKFNEKSDLSKYSKIIVASEFNSFDIVCENKNKDTVVFSPMITNGGKSVSVGITNGKITNSDLYEVRPIARTKRDSEFLGADSLEYGIDPILDIVSIIRRNIDIEMRPNSIKHVEINDENEIEVKYDGDISN